MQIIHSITRDMANPVPIAPLCAVQGDGNTRAVELRLLENGNPWRIPEDASAAVAFRHKNGHKGLYNMLSDGTPAITMTENTVTAILAPAVFADPGEVSAAVVFQDEDLNQLATFPFTIRVAPNPGAGQSVANDYYRYSTMEALNQVIARIEEALDPKGKTILWNQLVDDATESASDSGITVTRRGTLVTITGTAEKGAYPTVAQLEGLTGGHQVLLRLPDIPNVTGYNVYEYDADSYCGAPGYLAQHSLTGGDSVLQLQPETAKLWIMLNIWDNQTYVIDGADYLNIFDLTVMFGSGNEPDAAQFAQWFPVDLYPYSQPVEQPAPGTEEAETTPLTGKKILVIGDSLSAANQWQKQLTALGATYTNHCLGGIDLKAMVDGASFTGGTLAPLEVSQVMGVDAILLFGGTNNAHTPHGQVGDRYPDTNTVAGQMQYVIDRIYSLLAQAGNLHCRVLVVTPYCFGPSPYVEDAFAEDGMGLAGIIQEVAGYNGIPAWNAYRNSGINPTTLALWGASASDHVHLNALGYAHLGRQIARFASREV